MDLDIGPSFSIEVSQLNQDIVNFLYDVFDKDSDDFHETRSKHRNNPAIMKRLHDKMAKKSKKKGAVISKNRRSTSSREIVRKKRRRIVEVTSRDTLPKILHIFN